MRISCSKTKAEVKVTLKCYIYHSQLQMKTLSKGRGKMPITAAAFPCWMATERPCRRNCKERGSPVSALISFAPAERGRRWPQAQIFLWSPWPWTRRKWWLELKRRTSESLAFSALLATNPASGCKGHVGWDYIKTLCIQYYTIIHIIAFCHSEVSGRL